MGSPAVLLCSNEVGYVSCVYINKNQRKNDQCSDWESERVN